ncbi:hypothetical protein Tco_1169790 [Tanacetum coccineum]
MVKRLCLVDDLKMLKITMSNTSSRNKLNPEVNDHYNIFSRESQKSILTDSKDTIKVKEFQRSFRHSDTEHLSRSDEVLKLKNFKKDATLKLSKSTNQEWYEHVSPEVTRSQDGKVTRWRNEIMLG